MSRKIVLLKSHFASMGGLEKYTLQLCKAFAEKEWCVTLLTTESNQPLPMIPNVAVVTLGKRKRSSWRQLVYFDKRVSQWLEEHPHEVVFGLERNRIQTHYRAGSGVHAAYLKRRAKSSSALKKISFSINPLHQTLLDMEKLCFEGERTKRIFTNSSMVKEEILQEYKTDPGKITVVPNGVEWKAFEFPFEQSHNPKPFRKNLGLPENSFCFLFVGHGYERKGLMPLLDAASLLPKDSFSLCVVGREKRMHHFRDQAQKLGIGNQVHFFGSQPSLVPFYQAADAVVIPSLYDPFANVTVEALAMGVRVLSSVYNGGKEVLTGDNGLVIPSLEDPGLMADILKKSLSLPKTQATASIIRHSIESLDFSRQLDKIVSLI